MTDPHAASPVVTGHRSPDLTFTVTHAGMAPLTAVPTLDFHLAIARSGGGPIRSILLTTDIRISPARRRHDRATQERLAEVFGVPERWAAQVRPLVWTRATTVVPPFDDRTAVVLPVPCTFDIELAATKYLRAVAEGDIPLDFLFSGTVFHDAVDGRLRTAQISWAKDTTYRLPTALWRQTTRCHGTDGGWIQLSHDSYERLDAYRARNALANWDQTAHALLDLDQAHADTAGAPWTP